MFNNDNFLYIDYECNKTHNFYALGYGNNEHTKQIILNKELIGFAKYHNLKLISPIEATIICLEEAYKKNYIIVAYSLAEKEYFSYLNKENLLNKYKDIPYLNLAKAAKKMNLKCKIFIYIQVFSMGMAHRLRSFSGLPPGISGHAFKLLASLFSGSINIFLKTRIPCLTSLTL